MTRFRIACAQAAAVALLVLAAAAPAPAEEALVFDDFEDGVRLVDSDDTTEGPVWSTYDDQTQRDGASTAAATLLEKGASDSEGALRVAGEIQPGFSFPYAGIAGMFDLEGTRHDLTGYGAVRFWARGNGDLYEVQVIIGAVTDGNHYSKVFATTPEWQEVEVSFEDLAQSPFWGQQVEWDPATIRGVSFKAGVDSQGDYFLEVDQIEFAGG